MSSTSPRVACVLAAVSVIALASARRAYAGDPEQVWKTIESEHYVIHYYEPLGDVARRVAQVGEAAHDMLVPRFGHTPKGKTQLVINDTTDSSNGSAQVVPRNAINLFASAPLGLSNLGDHDDWLFGLTAHEYAHILHLDSIDGLPKWYNRIVGKTWAPNQIQPRWMIEGIATYQESELSSSGRLRQSLFDMELRVYTLAGRFLSIDEMTNGPRRWPGGNAAYLYGSHFLKYVFDRFGDETLRKLSWAYGSNPVPWGLNQAIKNIVGKRFTELYDDWKASLRSKYRLQEQAIDRRGRREGRRLTFAGQGNNFPAYSKDGRDLLWWRADQTAIGKVSAMPVGKNIGRAHDIATIYRAGRFVPLQDGSLVVTRTRLYRSLYNYSDIYRWDARSRELERLTRGVRAHHPAVSPDERTVVFSMNGESRRVLAEMPLQADGPIKVLWQGDNRYDQVEAPAWSPDGRHIAFTAWRKGGYRDILILDRATDTVTELAKDRASDMHPVYDPSGAYLYYASDRSGIYNIYAYEFATKQTYQVTNVLGCAVFPAVSPDGKRMAYRGFDVDGYDLWEVSLDRSRWTPAVPYINDRPAPTVIADKEYPITAPRDYNPLETLAPQNYTAQLTTNSFGSAVTVATRGEDAARFHQYSLTTTIGMERGDVGFVADYSYRRLVPTLRLTVARSPTRRGGVIIDDVNTPFTEEFIGATGQVSFPVLRSNDGSATLSFRYDVDWLRNTDDDFEEPNPNQTLPEFPETDVTVATASMRLSYNNVRRLFDSVGPMQGEAFAVSIGANLPELGSDFHSLNIDYSARKFLKLPWGVTPTLTARLVGGFRVTNRRRSGTFSLGGVPDQQIVRAILDSTRSGSTGYLRGYPGGIARGRQFHLLNLEYRQLLVEFERGLSTLPFYIRRIHLAGLLDYGNAFSGPLVFEDFKMSLGAAARIDMLFGYFVAGSLDIGYSRGVSTGGIGETWMLLTGTL